MYLSSSFSSPIITIQFCLITLLFLCFASGLSAAAPTDTTLNPVSTACGDIVRNNSRIFLATDVKSCLLSVPFNPAVATRFLTYYHDTLQFHSTLGYLKSPPAGYQQPAVNLLGGLENLQISVDHGAYRNQYDFEVALQKLIYAAHDDHLTLVNGILGVFTFGAPIDIVSVSLDGIELPKPYVYSHLLDYQLDPTLKLSAISTFNGRPAIDYLREFGSLNSLGALEAHSEYNLLMSSPANEIQDYYSTWGGDANFYPPEDTLEVILENGTRVSLILEDNTQLDPMPWLALYNGPLETGPLETGGDFYNFFVLGLYPESYQPYADWNSDTSDTTDPEDTTAEASEAPSATGSAAVASETESPFETSATTSLLTPQPTGWNHDAYPLVPDVTQEDLGTYGGGFVSGYFLRESSIAVLSIPSFDARDEGITDFSNAVQDFLQKSQAAGMNKVVIDLQQNFGGVTMLAYDTFKQFFPTIDPYGGSRLRAQDSTNIIGGAMTKYFETLDENDEAYYDLLANEWVASKRLNADTDQPFVSWEEEFGPHQSNGDRFTTTQRFNLSDTVFNTITVGNPEEYFTVYGYGERPANISQPYAAEDIIMLSDSICASACSMFMEMMHHEAGVRTVVAGGLPVNGPMQAPSLTRGARSYTTMTLDQNFNFAQAILRYFKDENQNFIQNRTLDSTIISAGINLRDQVRKGEDIPLQFLYEGADCRIFYTPKTVYNYTALWQYAADAIWNKDPKKCVTGSIGYSTVNGTKTAAPAQNVLPPASSGPPVKLGAKINAILADDNLKPEPITSSAQSIVNYDGKKCNSKLACPLDYYCLRTFGKCHTNGTMIKVPTCVRTCPVNDSGYCDNGRACQALQRKGAATLGTKEAIGYCTQKKTACRAPTSTDQEVSTEDRPKNSPGSKA